MSVTWSHGTLAAGFKTKGHAFIVLLVMAEA